MSASEAQKRAISKYQDKLDTLRFRVPRGDGEIIKEHAASQGESLNHFVIRAIKETMERDNTNTAHRL